MRCKLLCSNLENLFFNTKFDFILRSLAFRFVIFILNLNLEFCVQADEIKLRKIRKFNKR